MRNLGVCVALGLVALVGCQSGGDPEPVMKEMISVLDEMSTVFEKSKDAKEAKPKLEALSAKFSELKKKADGIKVSKDTEEKLKTKYEPELKKSMGKFMGAAMSFGLKDPTGMKDLEPVMKSFGK